MRDAIRFALNGAVRAVDDVPPHMTLLNWLRAEGLTAAKEGCAEGDCGACTVLLGTPLSDGRDGFDWRAVNACLVLVPQVDGRAVVTAEGLAKGGATPHAAQTLMAETHATQCGYCTPGFVMALAALGRTPARDDETVMDAIAGNLCRCTGYRPILEAARALPLEAPAPEEAALADKLREIAATPLDYRAGSHRFLAPTTLDDALRLRQQFPEAWLWAGGTDQGLRVTKQFQVPPAVIYLGRVPGLRGITEDAGGLTIAANTPYADALEALAALAPGLEEMVRRIGAAQVRNLGTLGGNIGTASPIGDTLPPLIALDAEITLASAERGRRTVAANDFVTGYRKTVLEPDELIVAIRIPRPAPGTHIAAYKIAKRVDQDISTVAAAFALRVEDGRVAHARLAYGGVAATPVRAERAEKALLGKPWTPETVSAAKRAVADDISPMDDARGTAAYRTAVAANLLDRLWHETTDAAEETPARLEAL